jgi:formyl-CoA transferase
MKALYEREKTGNGSRIDISLFYSSLSYQAINITMNQNFGTPIERTGNNQRFFAPASVYPSSDGFVYLAIGNDRQYKVLTKVSGFKSLHHQKFETNEKRVQNKVELNCEIEKVTKNMASSMIEQLLSKAGIPIAKVQSIDEVIRSPLVSQRMLKTIDPVTGLNMTLSPPPNSTDFMNMSGNNISFAPRLGEHNEEIFKNLLGYDEQSLKKFKDNRII